MKQSMKQKFTIAHINPPLNEHDRRALTGYMRTLRRERPGYFQGGAAQFYYRGSVVTVAVRKKIEHTTGTKMCRNCRDCFDHYRYKRLTNPHKAAEEVSDQSVCEECGIAPAKYRVVFFQNGVWQ